MNLDKVKGLLKQKGGLKEEIKAAIKDLEPKIRNKELTYNDLAGTLAKQFGKEKAFIYTYLQILKTDEEVGHLIRSLEETKKNSGIFQEKAKQVLKEVIRNVILNNAQQKLTKLQLFNNLRNKGYKISYNTFKKLLAQAVEEVLNELENQDSVREEKQPQTVKSDEETQRENIPTGESPKTDTEKPPLKEKKEIKSTSKGKKVEPLKKEPVKAEETNPLSVRETEKKKIPKKSLKPSVPENFDWNKYAYELANTPLENWNITLLLALDNKERFEFLRDKVAKCMDKRNFLNLKGIWEARDKLGLTIEQVSDILKMAGTWKTWKSLIKRDVLLYGKEKAKEIHKGKIEKLKEVCPEDYIENYVLKGELEN